MKNKKPQCKKPRTSGVRLSKRYTNKLVSVNKKVAIIIPIAPKHFHYVRHIYEKTKNHVDVYWIFSTKEDLRQFNFEKKIPIKSIILKDEIKDEYEASYRSIVTSKKWIGLYTLWKKRRCNYDFIGVFDAEIKIIRPEIIANAIYKIGVNKKILSAWSFGNINQFVAQAKNFIIDRFNSTHKNKKMTLKNLFKFDDSEYPWFSNIPVYSRDDTLDFFSHMGFKAPFSDVFLSEFYSWELFDHIAYAIWCVNKRGYKTRNSMLNDSFESCSGEQFKKAHEKENDIFWISRHTANQIDPNDECMKNICIEYHQDR